MERIDTADVTLTDEAIYYRSKIVSLHGDEAKHEKTFPMFEWKRLSYVFRLLHPSESLMEIGPGRGHFTRMLNRSQMFKSTAALDIVERRALPGKVDFRIGSITNIEDSDKSFQTVLCMEVLEHLNDVDFAAGLSEIRRVCSGQLIVSVPFDENPLPPYHKQRFSEARIHELFPTARKTVLAKPNKRTPWVIIEETMTG